jgi:lysophospholipase L1-like esterase
MYSHINRRSFLSSSAALTGLILLESCTKPMPVDPTPEATPATITAWGDSLTQGAGGTPYPQQLNTILTGRTIRNFGIGGQGSQQIAARQGSVPVTLTVNGNAFSGTAAVRVTAISNQLLSTPAYNDPVSLKGTVSGVACTLTRVATGAFPNQVETYTLTPTSSSSTAIPVNSFFVSDDATSAKKDVQLLWMGRNNVADLSGVANLIDGCVTFIDEPRRYLVVGILPSQDEPISSDTGKKVAAFNAALKAKYGDNYIESTPPTDAELTALSYSPSSAERTQIQSGVFPSGFHADTYHLKTNGYRIFADRIAAKLKSKNW